MSNRAALVERAAAFAREAHASQRRKGVGGALYFVHLESVVQKLYAYGYDDETLLAAAYLHDVMEDQPSWIGRMVSEFPQAVVATVDVLTEQKLDADGNQRPKSQRVDEYIAKLGRDTPESQRAVPISCADKLDNVSSLLESQRAGDQLLSVLNTRPGQYAAQLERLRQIYAPRVAATLLSALDDAVADLLAYISRWVPGHALSIAAYALQGSVDSNGELALLHTMRVVSPARTAEEQMLAALHAVVGMPAWPSARLADEGIPASVLTALEDWSRPAAPHAARTELSATVLAYDIADVFGGHGTNAPAGAEHLALLDSFHRSFRALR